MRPEDAIASILQSCQPTRVLACGNPARDISRQWFQAHPETDLTEIASAGATTDPALQQPYDLALVTDTIEQLSPEQASLLLGQLRNLGSQQIAVLAPEDKVLAFRDYIGLGFVRHAKTESDPPRTLFTYNIATYNHKRDWNNSKNWANPEMWGKARW
jgi:hypothetical protein